MHFIVRRSPPPSLFNKVLPPSATTLSLGTVLVIRRNGLPFVRGVLIRLPVRIGAKGSVHRGASVVVRGPSDGGFVTVHRVALVAPVDCQAHEAPELHTWHIEKNVKRMQSVLVSGPDTSHACGEA